MPVAVEEPAATEQILTQMYRRRRDEAGPYIVLLLRPCHEPMRQDHVALIGWRRRERFMSLSGCQVSSSSKNAIHSVCAVRAPKLRAALPPRAEAGRTRTVTRSSLASGPNSEVIWSMVVPSPTTFTATSQSRCANALATASESVARRPEVGTIAVTDLAAEASSGELPIHREHLRRRASPVTTLVHDLRPIVIVRGLECQHPVERGGKTRIVTGPVEARNTLQQLLRGLAIRDNGRRAARPCLERRETEPFITRRDDDRSARAHEVINPIGCDRAGLVFEAIGKPSANHRTAPGAKQEHLVIGEPTLEMYRT